MKKQINSISKWSVKSVITVTILSAMLCSLEVNAKNKPSIALNAATEEMEVVNGIESWMNSNTYWAGSSDIDEMIELESANSINHCMVPKTYSGMSNQFSDEAEIVNEIESWMNCSSYWDGNKASKNLDVLLMIESWMSSTSYWTNGKSSDNQRMDQSTKTISRCFPIRKSSL